jgi:hypothetical protein
MARKRKHPRRTPEEEAEFERHTQMIRERLAWREAKQREMDASREREQQK